MNICLLGLVLTSSQTYVSNCLHWVDFYLYSTPMICVSGGGLGLTWQCVVCHMHLVSWLLMDVFFIPVDFVT